MMYILAVDDDPIILELLTHFIATMPEHELVTAECVSDAVDIIATQERIFDCFLLDIQMPGVDGIEFCEGLRGVPQYKQTPILMLTAMSEKSYIDNAFRAGATDYINKPFDINSLKGRLKLVERIALDARQKTDKIFVANTLRQKADDTPAKIDLHHPFPIFDVEGVIENHALENYVTQLSRGSLCGSVVLGFTVRNTADLFYSLSAYDFSCLITDVSEAIADCLLPTQRLVSYAGNGTFVCVVEGAAEIHIDRLVNQMNLHIRAMELCQSTGEPLDVRLCAGIPSRLVWRKGDSALDALRQAHISAEEKAMQMERERGSLWIEAKSA